jgi:prepilin-type N-terminal cleavage/methylation domain-containing protein
MKKRVRNGAGFTLVEIMIVVAIIGMLASIAIPSYAKARDKARAATCISNLQAIDGAIQQWALDARKQAGDPVQYCDISSYLKRSVVCPSGGSTFEDSYQVTSVDAPPSCLRVTSGEYAHRVAL